MAQHTPGPWVLEENNNRPGYYIYSEAGDCVVVHIDRSKDASVAFQSREEVDARLIAAAPALAKALDDLLTYDRVERPAFRAKPAGAPDSTARIREDKLIALEDAAFAALALLEAPNAR